MTEAAPAAAAMAAATKSGAARGGISRPVKDDDWDMQRK
eukprot:gene7313-8482_t